ncbi:MAG TPA: DUF1553 domain-containing protein [Planctomycetota bacterium]
MILALLISLQDPDGVAFFEKKIRPVLVERCYECHSAQAKRLKGNLYLDSRDGARKGGDLGPAVVPGDAKSTLLKALRWEDEDLRMPPKQKLSPEIIADFEAWIARGAADPRTSAAAVRKMGMSVAEGRSFWSYQPVAAVKGDIDALVRAAAPGVEPAPPADRATLLRRLTYDLHGLPPTPEEVDAFVASGDVEKVVDRLLASPRFGERWGRHWLDVARYAESLTLRGFVMKEAWRYRDYVIESVNADVPFDRFVREQIAGDLIPGGTLEDKRRRRIATTFLTMGNNNLEEQDKKQLEMDVVDEQIDTVSRAVLAQTISCARCHDHKFDPIPTKDYYAIAGIFKNARMLEHANVSKWIEMPLPSDPAREAEWKKHDDAVAALQQKLKAERARTAPKDKPDAPSPVVLPVLDVPGIVVDDAKAEQVGNWKASKHSGRYIGDGYLHDNDERKGEKSLTFHPELKAGKYEVRLAYQHGESRATNVPVSILTADGERDVVVNMKEQPPIDGRWISLGEFRFENNQGYVMIATEGTKGHVTADAVQFLPAGGVVAKSAEVPGSVKDLEAEIKRMQEQGPRRDMVMSVREEPKILDLKIHLRGSVHTQGELAPRGVLQVATLGAPPAMPADQSGRLQLAEWMVSKENPLTSRVFANRAWLWLMGAGIVRTPDTFGTTGERPSNPALLDHLAARFVEDGWSVKKLVRAIVLSKTYQMSSTTSAKALEADPENRLFTRANRRRLDAESLRDTMLWVSGKLDLQGGGPGYPASLASDYSFKSDKDVHRSVYVPVFRNALPEIFEVFDFADTSVATGRRESSTIAPQALYFMNSPFAKEHAAHAAARLAAETPDEAARIARAWRLTLGRAPSAKEVDIARRYLAKSGWAGLVQTLFASIEFRYAN